MAQVTFDTGGITGSDYAMLLCITNPSHPAGHIVVAAGCQTFGTFGACTILKDIEKYPAVRNLVPYGAFEVIAEIALRQGQYQEPKVIYCGSVSQRTPEPNSK